MFLFTNTQSKAPVSTQAASTQAVPEPGVDAPVAEALRGVAQQSGVSFGYLVKTAERESNLDPAAKSRSSSATGLFQFLDQTWLQTIKSSGHKIGLEREAEQIVQGANGQFSIPDPPARQRILNLRTDPEISARVAAVFTQKNQAVLADTLGRNPSEGELYIAHFLGASGATDLIRLASQSPTAPAAASFVDAAGANRSIFYDKSGRARSAAEVYSNLVSGHSTDLVNPSPDLARTQVVTAAAPITIVGGDPSSSTYRAKEPIKPLFGLFRGADTGPVAQPILNAWTGVGRNAHSVAVRAAVSNSRGGFFPRESEALGAQPAAQSGPSDNGSVLPDRPETKSLFGQVPLPPRRPAELGASQPKRQTGNGNPLDLLSFTRQRV